MWLMLLVHGHAPAAETGGQVAIFDATNTTKERRQQLVRTTLLLVSNNNAQLVRVSFPNYST